MSAQNFSLAMGEISDKYVNEAIAYHCEKKQPFSIRHKWLTRVACLFLVVLLGGGAVLTFSVEARAAFFGWVRQQYETFYEYFFEGETAVTNPAKYELGWVPEELELVYFGETAGGEVYIYKDEQGAMIEFYYISEPEAAKMYIDSVENKTIDVTINGYPGKYSVTPSETETDHIIWTDETRNVLFYISGHFDKETFIRMAESVQEIE